jgi:hypothetical protein
MPDLDTLTTPLEAPGRDPGPIDGTPGAALRYQHATAERGAEIAAKLETFAASTRPERVVGNDAEVVDLR